MRKLTWGWSTHYASFRSYRPLKRSFYVRYGHTVYPSFWRLFRDQFWDRPLAAWRGHLAEKHAALGGCERCGSFWRLTVTSSMSAYHWNGEGLDPNRNRLYCEPCSLDYVDYMTEKWREYYSSQGY